MKSLATIQVKRAIEGDLSLAAELIEEYYEAVAVVARDSRDTLDKYAADPLAGIWIAYSAGAPAGCIVLRVHSKADLIGEVKRLYVRPAFRGQGIAWRLLSELETFATARGFRWLYLDSKDDLQEAIRFYQKAGYQPRARYNDNPQATIFMEKELTASLVLRSFEPGDEDAFCRLNEAWIEKYFKLEDKDRKTLREPDKYILSKGGHIFMALREGIAVGCCALIFMKPGEYELSKMGVAETERGRGIGRRLLQYAIAEAKRHGATRLYLETNHILKNAIHLYEAVGFSHLDPAQMTSPYERADVFMEMAL